MRHPIEELLMSVSNIASVSLREWTNWISTDRKLLFPALSFTACGSLTDIFLALIIFISFLCLARLAMLFQFLLQII